MKRIRFNVDEVIGRLSLASSVIQPKNPIPILGDLLFKTYTNNKTAVVTSSDSEVWLDMKLPLAECEQADDFSFAVNAKDFVTALRSLSGHVVDIEVDDYRHVVTGIYENGHFELPVDNVDEFPTPVLGGDGSGTMEVLVDSVRFCEAMSYVKFAAGTNLVTTPYMNGLHFEFTQDGMQVTATDRNSMSVYEDSTVKSSHIKFTLPNKTVQVAGNVMQKMEGDVKIASDGKKCVLSRSEFRLVSRLLEGNFPDCKRYFASSHPISITVCRTDLLNAIRRVLLFGNQTSERVEFSLTKDTISVSSKDADFSKAASETVNTEYDGEDFSITFSGGMMMDMLNNLSDDNVILNMSEPNKPIVSVPESEPEYGSVICQIMPMI